MGHLGLIKVIIVHTVVAGKLLRLATIPSNGIAIGDRSKN